MTEAPRALKLFNTLGRRLETFVPLVPGLARLYTCGPTVYNHAHIGNLRTFLFEDLLRRTLAHLGFRVDQVMNLTDVDDKTIRGALAGGVSLADYTAPFVASFFADLDTLHVERAERYPRATEHIPEMQQLIARLIERGHAYASDGSIWFRIASDADYGRLSGFDLTAARQGERVASDEYEKEDVRDFVLWKGAKEGEPSWDSPWGPGRPGWHIECSAMSMKYLGESFDLHCGGVDNVFPHHENEIAQSESATGVPFVRYWVHSEHLLVDGEKMSKSLGNVYALADLLARGLPPRAIRYLMLSVHYRQKLNFTFASVEAAATALRRIDELRYRLGHAVEGEQPSAELAARLAAFRERFDAALSDDLNAAGALAAVFDLVRESNAGIDRGILGTGDRERILAAIAWADEIFAAFDSAAWPAAAKAQGPGDEEIEALVRARQAARQRRDFAAADELRQKLDAAGVAIEDTPQGPRWKRR